MIELNRRRNRAIVSERAAMQEKRAAEKERLLQELNEGEIRTGRIASIRDFGIFVDVGGADGLVHLSELSWERTPKSPHDLFKAGDEVEVYVLKVDQENKKIALSLRRAQPERWEEIVSDFREGQIVPGEVTKLAPFGAFARLEGPIEGLIHISELVDRRINHPREVVDEGDVVPVKIVRIEHDRHRLGLSLRQAHDKAEEDGWMFNDSGGVVSAPPEALARLGLEAPAKPEAEVTEAEAEEPELGSVAAAFAEAEVAAEEARGEAEEAPEAEEPTEAPEAVAEEPEPVEAAAPEADVPAEEEAPEAEEPTEAPEAVAEEPEPVEAGAPEAGVAAEEEAPEAEEAAKVEEGLAEEPETVEAEAPEADVAAEEEAPEAEETTEAPEAVAEEPEPVEAGAPEAEDTTEEPEAGEVEAAEEEADTTGPSEDEEKPPVTESGADALNKEEEVPPAEAESAADEGSEPEEDETSG